MPQKTCIYFYNEMESTVETTEALKVYVYSTIMHHASFVHLYYIYILSNHIDQQTACNHT